MIVQYIVPTNQIALQEVAKSPDNYYLSCPEQEWPNVGPITGHPSAGVADSFWQDHGPISQHCSTPLGAFPAAVAM